MLEIKTKKNENNLLIHFIYFLMLFERERERANMSGGGAERDRDRDRVWSRLQAPSCQHRARRGAWTQELREHNLSWRQTLNQLSHPGVPMLSFFKCGKEWKGLESPGVFLVFSVAESTEQRCPSDLYMAITTQKKRYDTVRGLANSCVTLGKLLNLAKPKFCHLCSRDKNNSCLPV